MVQTPLFVDTNTNLRKRLRLSGLATGSDGEFAFEHALIKTRVRFVRRLGLTRIATIVAYAATTTPTSDNETMRLVADQLEEKMVRAELIRSMGLRLLDGTEKALQEWNDEGTLRGMTNEERASVLLELEQEIEADLELLEGAQEIQEETEIEVRVMEPDIAPPRPFDSLRGGPSRGIWGCE